MVARALQQAVADAPAAAVEARPAQFAQPHRADGAGGVGEQGAALAPAADEMLTRM